MQELPDALNEELTAILGRPCFMFIKDAQFFRLAGFDIPKQAESEQAFFIHRMLGHWFKHGDEGWRAAVEADWCAVHDKARAMTSPLPTDGEMK